MIVPLALRGTKKDQNMKNRKVILIVLDSAGCGAMPDAAAFGDAGADTLGHIIQNYGLRSPNMDALGLRNIRGTSFYAPRQGVLAAYGRAAEKTHAKDTTCGHFEIAGFVMKRPFRTYPNGFPDRVMREFERRIGRKTLGNCVASGTQIIQELGEEHQRTGWPIVYTSADSVFQVAAHEEVIPLGELYGICRTARELLMGGDLVGRVIARPFVGEPGAYVRTEHRRDFALPPEEDTVLNAIANAGMDVVGVGKIEDIFCRSGITQTDHTTNNHDGIEAAVRYAADRSIRGLVFVNLVDFDMLYGHRDDPVGYKNALEYFDKNLPRVLSAMGKEDLLILTADHGCDPCFPGTDHTREYIPILAYSPARAGGEDLGTRTSFADIAATAAAWLGVPWHTGTPFFAPPN